MACGFNTQYDVLQHGKIMHQFEVLMNHSNAQIIGIIWILDLHFHSIFFDDPLLRLIESKKNAHQRGFSSTVLSQQGMDLTLFQLQGDLVVGDDPGKFLGDLKHFDDVVHMHTP